MHVKYIVAHGRVRWITETRRKTRYALEYDNNGQMFDRWSLMEETEEQAALVRFMKCLHTTGLKQL